MTLDRNVVAVCQTGSDKARSGMLARQNHGGSSVARNQCLQCGMAITSDRCPKCDAVIADQTDGSTDWIDIAHDGQTVKEALSLLDRELRYAKAGLAKYLVLIVGNGKIRLEVLARLGDMQFRQEVIGYKNSDANPGQIMVQIKP